MDRIKVKAVEDRVVFAVQANGTLCTPMRAIGRDGPRADSPVKPEGEDVPDYPTYRNALAAGDLELFVEPAAVPVVAPAETPIETPAEPTTESENPQ